MNLQKQLQSLGKFARYVWFTLAMGLLLVIAAIFFTPKLAGTLLFALTFIYLLVILYRLIYYRLFINRYLANNLKYLGDKYTPPFLSRTFLNGLILGNKEDSVFTDFKALTHYKELKILVVLGGAFLAFLIVSTIILLLRSL